jgi:Transposase and inactivated derivatives
MNKFLTEEERTALKAQHRRERDKRVSDRLKAILLADDGWTQPLIAKALLLDDQTIGSYVKDYKESGKLKHESGGSTGKLTAHEAKELESHLETTLYLSVKEICAYVEKAYGKQYTVAGMQSWMHHHKFVYKNPKGIPAKANLEAQEEFIAAYENLMNTTPEDEPILFGDCVHPTQATKLSRGWIKKGKEQYVPTTGSRTRVNIAGAINLQSLEVMTRDYDQINSGKFIDFLKYLEACYSKAPKIHLFVDQGSYHTSQETKEYVKNSRVILHYLPAYSPNLNPIERLWKIMHEYVSNNKFYLKGKDFIAAVRNFFDETVHEIKDVIQSRVTDNFERLNTQFSF